MANWIRKALKNHVPGATHRHLRLPESKTLPYALLLQIKYSPIGTDIRYVYRSKTFDKLIHRTYTVTPLLKKRAVLAVTLRGMN